jgi:hypothetical protein
MTDAPDDLDRMIGLAIKQAETVLLDQPGASMIPTFVMEDPGDRIVVFGTPWETEAHKEITCLALRAIMRESGTLRYCFMSEAWMAIAPPGTDEHTTRLKDHEQPSNRPDRVEVVVITASDASASKSAMLRIVRGEAGTVVRLDRDRAEMKSLRGRFSNLLQPDDQS